jgi:hypothetical protein
MPLGICAGVSARADRIEFAAACAAAFIAALCLRHRLCRGILRLSRLRLSRLSLSRLRGLALWVRLSGGSGRRRVQRPRRAHQGFAPSTPALPAQQGAAPVHSTAAFAPMDSDRSAADQKAPGRRATARFAGLADCSRFARRKLASTVPAGLAQAIQRCGDCCGAAAACSCRSSAASSVFAVLTAGCAC